jgi:hypothetical protein
MFFKHLISIPNANRRDNGEELGDKNEWDNKADVNFTDGLSPSLENAPNNSVDHGISAGSKAICRNNQTLLDRVKLNMKESENLRNRITDKRKGRHVSTLCFAPLLEPFHVCF